MRQLTKREFDTAQMLVDGLSNKEIAQREHISVNAVKWRLTGLYRKMGIAKDQSVMSRLRLASQWIRSGDWQTYREYLKAVN